MIAPVARAQGLIRRFERPGGEGVHEVLSGVTLEVAPGSSIAIVGPSGSGKSTLLHLLAGLDVPDEGEVQVGGEVMSALDEDGRAALRARHVGIVLQRDQLLSQCTAFENVLLPTLSRRGSARHALHERATRLLGAVGLEAFMAHTPAQLSVGQRQRVAIARALILSPRLLLADEPTGALDRESSDDLVALLGALRDQEDIAMVIVTHDEAVVSGLDEALALRDGVLTPRTA